ncbi:MULTISPECIES: transposase [unclassified Endozoicomonas]|uniref:transposase n=1 Tax=unclassified Endozoicomonas TaxID=2644528 RepID=UPI003BB7BB87
MDVVTGKIIPLIRDTRAEIDFSDLLNTHMCEAAVMTAARVEKTSEEELGTKRKSGILQNLKTRAMYLTDPTHKIMFHYTPKHACWLNQIEIWFSILVRRFLKRNSFTTKEDLKVRLYGFIEFFNERMAKPFKWAFKDRPLQV